MDIFSHHKLINTQNGVEVILYMDSSKVEFSHELGKLPAHQKISIENEAKNYVKKHLSHLKINSLKIMSGFIVISGLSFATMKDKAEASSINNMSEKSVTYVVKEGDTLSEIAKNNMTTIDRIMSTNQLANDQIYAGQVLTIPTGDAYINPYAGEKVKAIPYTVKQGDTISQIAKNNRTTIDEIKKMNQLTNDTIYVGQVLTIPTGNTNINPYTGEKENSIQYTVKQGDTISQIAKNNRTTIDEIKKMNQLTNDTIYVGQVLTISAGNTNINPYTGDKENTTQYTVKQGDTISQIAKNYDTTVNAIKTANDLTNDTIKTGQELFIPTTANVYQSTPISKQHISEYSQEDLLWLSKIIYSEARGEPLEGQIAVAAVILNRVKSDGFPNSVKDVIFEQNNGRYQFTPAGTGSIYDATPTETNILAAERALNGEDPTNGSLYFYNPSMTDDKWIRTRPVSTTIGNHVFAF